MTIKRRSRREFLKLLGVGAGSLAINACSILPNEIKPGSVSSDFRSTTAPSSIQPSISVDLTAQRTTTQILAGQQTPILKYQTTNQAGTEQSVQQLQDSYLGPIFRVKKGQRVQVRLINELSDPTIIHWHGLRIPEEMDGHPRFAIAPGEKFSYDFQVTNRAGTYWFHPHPDMLTGKQVYFGLAGLFIVSDDEEAGLGLPAGDFDIPLVIQDRVFDSNNQMVYMPNGMMDRMIGFLGDTILVNGQPEFSLNVKSGSYRLRLLNGSNSRIYKLAWQDGTPLTIIATDGGLLEYPVTREYVTLAPGERVELWADFSDKTENDEIRLVSLPFSGFNNFGGMMMRGNTIFPNGASFDILHVKISGKNGSSTPLPTRLSTIERFHVEDAVNRNNPRSFSLEMRRMVHTINGRVFEMDSVTKDETVRLGDLEIWEFINLAGSDGGMGGGMMNIELPHPMHIHGVQFQVLSRQIGRGYQKMYQELNGGFIDEGWKDTVLVMPGEKVQVLVRFEEYSGNYLYHCHNLEHEDAGMMRNYRIES